MASLIEGALATHSVVSVTGIINTTSTSYINYTSASVAATARAGDVVLLIGNMRVSASGASVRTMMQFTEDASVVGQPSSYVAYRTDTGGEDGTIANFEIHAPSAGAHTYRLQWKNSTGTCYSAGAYLIALMLRES